MIIGGIAVIARGVPRLTRDVDLTVAGASLPVGELLEELDHHRIAPRIEDARGFAEAHQVLLLRHRPTSVDVDVSIAWLPFELDALAAADVLSLAGTTVRVARAEDLLVYKAIAWRPQDQQDIERLLVLHGHTVDLARVRTLVGEFAAALDDTERPSALDRLIARALSER